MLRRLFLLFTTTGLVLGAGCSREAGPRPEIAVETLFTSLPPAYTGIDFENRLADTEAFNIFTYRNYYNGGGVGLGDFDGDGRRDIYLTGNHRPNRLYLNRGDFQFEDVTEEAGVAGRHAWSTGVTLADVNGDGRLDIYVSNAGNARGDDQANELFINLGTGDDGVPRFEEQAAEYGLDDQGYSTHAAFFDYDRDGDLDAYVLNNSPRPVSSFGLKNIRHVRHDKGGDRLYRNDPGASGQAPRFTDVSAEAGIRGSEIAFGLGVSVGDVNRDGWPDLYISNDFFERDYLYLNNGDGTFSDRLEDAMPTISLSSMGADVADIDNDALPEIYVTDMLPESDHRLKTTSAYESWDIYQEKLKNGFYHQFTRNTLQHNQGDGTFSEIGQMAGVAATDWSWGALFADFDGDGWKDLFVSNGVFRDVIDQDFVAYFGAELERMAAARQRDLDFLEMAEKIPSHPLSNYAFHNDGGLAFTNRAEEWGLAEPSFSNGAAYADLDDDGDLDLVVSNVNRPPLVYRNEADTLRATHHYLQLILEGTPPNTFGLGTQVTAWHAGIPRYQEQMPTRGFQSTVDHVLTFGLGDVARLDSLVVVWPDDRVQVLTEVAADQKLTLRQAEASPGVRRLPVPEATPIFADVTGEAGPQAIHRENRFVDFDRERMLPKMLSTEGPALAVADVNGDGRDDVFVGGAKEAAGQLLLQQADGRFTPASEAVFQRDAISEDVAAVFFDADGDGDPDLYVGSGGNEYGAMAPALRDRLYLNQGRGRFEKATDRLPRSYASTGAVAASDFDGDGDVDLFVGGRVVPWRYGEPAESLLLRNDGRGTFEDATDALAPALRTLGMVTDATFADVDGDRRADLIVAGEWMPLTIFRNTGSGFEQQADDGLAQSHGLWNRLAASDLDGDGDTDFIAGNLGFNTKLRASAEEPLTLHAADFDSDGRVEQILSVYQDGKSYPLPLRHDLVRNLPFLEARLPRFTDYAGRSVAEVFTEEELAEAVVQRAYVLASSLLENQGDGTFVIRPLPRAAQVAPVFGILPEDFDGDGRVDVLLAGNFLGVRPDLGQMASSYGLFLRGNGRGGFEPLPARESGFLLRGQARALRRLGPYVLAAMNNDTLRVFTADN